MTTTLLAAAMLLQAAAVAAPQALSGSVPADVPVDWSTLPELPYAQVPHLRGGYVRFVMDEVKSGRCSVVPDVDGTFRLRVPLVVQLAAGGGIRRMVPAAIGCPTVEQYTVGLVQNLTRDNLRLGGLHGEGWYRTAMTYSWK